MGGLRLAIAGAGGRMGRVLVRLIAESDDLTLAGALEHAGSDVIGEDAGLLAGTGANGIAVTGDPATAIRDADVVVDFSTPAASAALAAVCATAAKPAILGATGWALDQDTAVIAAARRTAIVRSGNFSLGVNLLAALVRKAAASLDADFDIEIVDMHHNRKVDAPSGTALLLGEAAAEGRGITLDNHSERGRDGHTGARARGAIGFAALRGGTVTGEHTVWFAGPSERLALTHIAEDRALFARGALAAARWVHERPPGLYSMADVLGLTD